MNQHLGKGSTAMSCQNQPKKLIKTHSNKWQKNHNSESSKT